MSYCGWSKFEKDSYDQGVRQKVPNPYGFGTSEVRLSGLEPETYGLKVRCSTN